MYDKLKRLPPKPKQEGEIVGWQKFPHGLNTDQPAFMLKDTEFSESTNWLLQKGGGLAPRPGMLKITTAAMSDEIVDVQETPIGLIATCIDGNVYTIESGVPTLRANLPGPNPGMILSYNNAALLFDGL